MVKVKRIARAGLADAPWCVGIDQSYAGFAIAFFRPGEPAVLSRMIPSKNSGVERLHDIMSWLDFTVWNVTHPRGFLRTPEMVNPNVVHVCIEGYAPGSKFGREKAGELGAAVKLELCRIFPVPVCYPTIIAPSKLKKYVTGKGDGPKDEMRLKLFQKWGVETRDNNEADAYGLARMAAAIVSVEQPSFSYEQEALDGLTRHTEWQQSPEHLAK